MVNVKLVPAPWTPARPWLGLRYFESLVSEKAYGGCGSSDPFLKGGNPDARRRFSRSTSKSSPPDGPEHRRSPPPCPASHPGIRRHSVTSPKPTARLLTRLNACRRFGLSGGERGLCLPDNRRLSNGFLRELDRSELAQLFCLRSTRHSRGSGTRAPRVKRRRLAGQPGGGSLGVASTRSVRPGPCYYSAFLETPVAVMHYNTSRARVTQRGSVRP